MDVKEIMTEPVTVVGEDCTLEETARLMLEKNIGGVPVVDPDGNLRGIVTESDFSAREKFVPFSIFSAPHILGRWLPKTGIEAIFEAARKQTAGEIMSRPVVTLTEDDSVEKAVELMLRHEINRIPVVRGERPVGMIARRDLLRLFSGKPAGRAGRNFVFETV